MQSVSTEKVWRGVDGEWNEVLALVARVRGSPAVLPLLPVSCRSSIGHSAAPIQIDGDSTSRRFRTRIHLSSCRDLGPFHHRGFEEHGRNRRSSSDDARGGPSDVLKGSRHQSRSAGRSTPIGILRQGVRQTRTAVRSRPRQGAKGRPQESRSRRRRGPGRHRRRCRRRAGSWDRRSSRGEAGPRRSTLTSTRTTSPSLQARRSVRARFDLRCRCYCFTICDLDVGINRNGADLASARDSGGRVNERGSAGCRPLRRPVGARA